MEWQNIDFHGITILNESIVYSLKRYLDEREAKMIRNLLEMFTSTETQDSLALSDNIQKLTELFNLKEPRPHLKENFITYVNAEIWEYTEIIESCTTELFQQVDQLHFKDWHPTLLEVVKEIKEVLRHKIEQVLLLTHALETSLADYLKRVSAQKKWREWLLLKQPKGLDPNIIIHLETCRDLLTLQYDTFSEQFHKYSDILKTVENLQEKIDKFHLLSTLDDFDRTHYLEIFRLLKIWELIPHSDTILKQNITTSLRPLLLHQEILFLYNRYFEIIKEGLFEGSKKIKSKKTTDSANSAEQQWNLTQSVHAKILHFQEELKDLISTLTIHREYILNSDPNPYVKSRLGFSERPVGVEPTQAKNLLKLIYKAEELQFLYTELLSSLQKPAVTSSLQEIDPEIDSFLHQMTLPLISKPLMTKTANKFLSLLSHCNEFTSREHNIVHYFAEKLNLALRADWKYHTLYEIPEFHQIFSVHANLTKEKEDSAHLNRLLQFKQLCTQIEEWLDQNSLFQHYHEMELNKNDIKMYIQTFFTLVQRLTKEILPNQIFYSRLEQIKHHLLDYRYLFGQFFYNISKKPEGQILRNEFLFVDQYFESIENILRDIPKIKKHVKDF